MPLAPTSALYYPYIDVRDTRWLKSAALFWQNIRTIVPEGFPNPYENLFAQELRDEGVLTPIYVTSDMIEIEELSNEVSEYLADPASMGVLFGNADGLPTLIHPTKLPWEIRRIAEIHPMKLPYLIRDQLEDCFSDRGFMQVDSGFAAFYMTLLARRLSDRLGLALVTGSNEADSFASSIRKGRAIYREKNYRESHHPREVGHGAMFDLMIKGINIPEDVSAKDLIRFRSDHSDELAALRLEIAVLMSELPEAQTLEALRQGVHDQYTNKVLPALNSLRRSLTALKWDSALNGFLKVSFFSAAPTSALALLHVPTPMALMAGVGVSVAATVVTCAIRRDRELEASPYSYLLACDRAWY